MSGILLDTHVWIWYVNGDETLKKEVRKTIGRAIHQNEAHLAAISLWELGMLDKKQRIILEMPCLEWMNKSLALTHIQVLPLTPAIASESSHLPGEFHDDPADRMIVATARVEGLTLVTRDKQMIRYGRYKYVATIAA